MSKLGSFNLDEAMKVVLGPQGTPVQGELCLLLFLAALLVLPELVNIDWFHQRLPSSILGHAVCLLFMLFDKSVSLWELIANGRWRAYDAREHHRNLMFTFANLAVFYGVLKTHS